MAEAAAFENPLIPHARLRQMLLAMHRVRALENTLPPRRRSGSKGLEACLVAPAIDLGPGDLVCDALRGPAVQFLRGASMRDALGLKAKTHKAVLLSDAGKAAALAAPLRPEERLWAALGAAAGCLAQAMAARSEQQSDRIEGRRPVLACYLRPGEASGALLARALQWAAEQRLPVLFVVLPALSSDASAAGTLVRVAQRAGIPAIAADRDDAVALYRVAQESLGRARAGGGPAMIQAVPFLPSKTAARQTEDPLAVIERYILERKIVTPEWIAREMRLFARHLAQPVH